MARAGFDEQRYLLETFRAPILSGRWLLVIAATVESAILWFTAIAPAARQILLLLLVYNLLSLLLVHRLPVHRIPVLALLALDLSFVAAVGWTTGGIQSPFLNQCYLIIYAGSLFFGLPGGIAVGTAAAAIAAALALQTPGAPAWDALRHLAPYFLTAGLFAGYLAEQLRVWYQRYRETREEARKRELQDELARRELELARSMQTAALPLRPPQLPGLELGARARFAREVGGDFYLFLTEGERLGIIVGDVSGKGFPAALVSTSIGHLLPWLRPLRDPLEALRNLNRDLLERLPGDAFASLVLAEVDPPRRTVRIWNAGHPPPLLWRAAEGRVIETRRYNRILGVFPTWDGEPETLPFEPDDVLMLCTDGLIEVRNAAGELFETGRAAAVLAECAGESAEAIAEALVRAAERWGAPTDDLTVVVCKRTE